MSNRAFVSLQLVMPVIIANLEMSYPNEFNDVNYTLYDHGKGLVGLNIHSEKYPSTLFWIDERFNVQPSFMRSTEAQRQFNSQLKKKISDLLKRAA